MLVKAHVAYSKALPSRYSLLAIRIQESLFFGIYICIVFNIIDSSIKSPNDRYDDFNKAYQFGWTIEVDDFLPLEMIIS